MGRVARVFVLAWLAAGCLDAPDMASDGGADAGPPGTTEWQIPLGDAVPYVADGEGSLMVAASLLGTAPLDPPVEAAGGGRDLLIASFSTGGEERFARVYGGPGDETATSISVSRLSGEASIIGVYLAAEGEVGGDPLPAPQGGSNVFVARYGASGNHLWSLAGDANAGASAGYSLSMSGAGAVALTGDYFSALAIADANLPHSGTARDLYVASVTSSGMVTDLVGFGDAGDQVGAGAVFDGLGAIYLFGTQTGPFAIGSFSPDADADGGMFVCQLGESNLEARWLFDSVGAGVGSLRGAVAPDGTLLLTGRFDGTFAFDVPVHDELTSRGGTDVFVAAISPIGEVAWLAQFGGPGDDEPQAIAVGPDGEIAITGSFRGDASLAGEDAALTSNGEADIFLISLAADGSLRWARGFGDVEDDGGVGVAVEAGGAVALTAVYRGEVDFGAGEPLVTGGGREGALIRFR